jgi:hypothetical protein
VASARAISRRRWSPYGRCLARALAWRATPTYSSSSNARRSISRSSRNVRPSRSIAPKTPARVRTCRPIITFSSAGRFANSRMFWKVRAIPLRATSLGLSAFSGWPSNVNVPASGA